MVVSYAASHSWIRYLTRWGSWIKEMLGILTFIRLGNIIALSAVAICCNCNYKNCIRCMSCILFYFNRYICLCRCLIRASHALFLSKTGIFLSSLQHFSVFVKFLSTNDSIGLRMECTYMSLFVIKACLAISSFSLFFCLLVFLYILHSCKPGSSSSFLRRILVLRRYYTKVVTTMIVSHANLAIHFIFIFISVCLYIYIRPEPFRLSFHPKLDRLHAFRWKTLDLRRVFFGLCFKMFHVWLHLSPISSFSSCAAASDMFELFQSLFSMCFPVGKKIFFFIFFLLAAIVFVCLPLETLRRSVFSLRAVGSYRTCYSWHRFLRFFFDFCELVGSFSLHFVHVC